MKIAYFVNQYPKVSHSFIRREIIELERQGAEVLRIALRGWDADIRDELDIKERELTQYVLRNGVAGLLLAASKVFLRMPGKFLSACLLAVKMGIRSDRPLPIHFIYLAEACQVALWLNSAESEHLHAHFGTNSAEVAMLAQVLHGLPYSFTVHGPEEFDKPEFIGLAEKIRRAAFVVAISSFGRSQLYRLIAHSLWPKVKVVHCALEESFFVETNIEPVLGPRLVCVGRLCEQKGQSLLLEAQAKLKQQGVNFELVLAGDGEMRAEIEALLVKFGLEQCVRITGWISSDQVKEEILAAKALVLPSFAEGLPVVIMEAFALKRPVLTTYVAGIPELVRPGENGWLFPAGSVDDLCTAIADCLACPVEVLAEMGEQGRRQVMEHHAIEKEVAKLYSLFKNSMQN